MKPVTIGDLKQMVQSRRSTCLIADAIRNVCSARLLQESDLENLGSLRIILAELSRKSGFKVSDVQYICERMNLYEEPTTTVDYPEFPSWSGLTITKLMDH